MYNHFKYNQPLCSRCGELHSSYSIKCLVGKHLIFDNLVVMEMVRLECPSIWEGLEPLAL